MPIVKKQDGWYWGSKGPFATKQKAIQVGHAARANGFKEESMDKSVVGEFIGQLLHSATLTHFKHFQTESYAVHKALNKYYDEIVELVDTLAEDIQGLQGAIIAPYPQVFGNTDADPLTYLKSIKDFVEAYRDKMPDATEIQNDIDAICTLINSTIYKLTFLK